LVNFLTIVTVNKNNFKGLLSTLISLHSNELNSSFNHLIIDGGSSDLTTTLLDLKKKYKFEFVSENDNGIYQAMNKGILLSRTDRLLFLNSGDTVIEIKKFENFIFLNACYDIVYSNVLKVNENNSVIQSRFPEILSLDYMICYGLPHQATIIKKSLFDKVGTYNENYTIISDWVFFMEAIFFHNATYKYVDVTAINFDGSGISNQTKYVKKIIAEQLNYISNRFPSKIELYKNHSPYVKKYFRTMPRWKRYFHKYLFKNFNFIIK
jgi:hypothetical protein